MYGYRRWGHNETDEPSFTQPLLYRAIQQRPSIRESYFEHLRATQRRDRRGSGGDRPPAPGEA